MIIVPVILLGGSGTRLWPVSRKNHPKLFLKLTGDQTLLQATLSRLDGIQMAVYAGFPAAINAAFTAHEVFLESGIV